MPRNEAKPLDEFSAARQRKMADALEIDQHVTLTYSKRDGSESRATGTVKFFNGKIGFDTGSVTVETSDRGPRTINLHRIIGITGTS